MRMDDGGPTAVSSTLKSGTQPVCVDPSLLTAALSMNGVGGGQAGGVAATLSPTQQALLASTLQQQQPQPLATPLAVPAATAALSPALTAVLPAAGAAAGAPALLAPALLSTAVPTVVPPTPAVLAALAAATEPAAAVNKAASVILLGPEQDTTARAPAPAAVGANQIAASPAGAQASAAAAEAEAAEAAAAADSMPDIPDPLDSQLATSPIGAAAADALAAALAASAAAQQQQQQQQEQEQLQQQQQAQVQQLLVHQEQMRQQMAQHQQQQAMLSAAMSPPSTTTAALTAELTAAGFTPAAAALAAQQQQQIQAQQQQLQQQQQMMASAGLTTATALVPTGATPAQLASGMPAVQAVSVLVPAAGPTSTSSAMSQPFAASQVLAQPSSNFSTQSLGGSTATNLSSAALGQALGATLPPSASGVSMLSAVTAPSLAGSAAGSAASSQISSALTKLAIAQQQQTQMQQQANAAANAAMLQAAASGASSSTMLPSVTSNMSLANLKSASTAASIASSVLSGVGLPTQLEPIPSGAPSGASLTTSGAAKVRVLLSSGGEYEEVKASEGGTGARSTRWRYVGGETRLVGLKRTNGYSEFLLQLSKATLAVWDESCRLMYDLPSSDADGGSGTLVDLIDDEDLEMMWEELDATLASKPTFRLHLYVQLGCKRSSSGRAESSIASEEHMSDNLSGSTPKSVAIAAATAAAAAIGSSSSNSTGTPRKGGGDDGQQQGSSSADSTGRGGGGGGGGGGGTASSQEAVDGSRGTQVTFTSSEYDELVEDIVSDKPMLALSELEAKLDIISTEDLTPVRLLGSGGFGEVYLCRWHSCDVAVKCLNPNLLVPDGGMGSISKDNVSELLREANLLGSVRHPNIVWVYGLVLPPLDAAVEAVRQGLAPGQGIDAVKVTMQMANKHCKEAPISALRPPALVTEYLASGSLRAAMARKAEFVTKDSVKIKLALDAARGMEYLHNKNIVHFDLKTANLLVGMRDKTPICKVADFGLSKQKQQTFVTGVATLRGTLPWIAPEIIKTPGSVTESVDVYSFGIVMWELWTLREPFEGINYHALLHMMSTTAEGVRPPLPGSADFEGDACPEPAPGWANMMEECWQEPDKRPTFKQLVGRLELMLRQNRMAKKRSASGPAGTGCVTSTPVSSG